MFDLKMIESKKKVKEAMSNMGMFVPSKVAGTRRNNNDKIEIQVIWALFEDDKSKNSWERMEDLPEW